VSNSGPLQGLRPTRTLRVLRGLKHDTACRVLSSYFECRAVD